MKRPEIVGLVLVLLSATGAAAHDGGFGHSRRTIWVAASPDELIVEYRITQNADEALLEMIQMDEDGDGQISTDEKDRHFSTLGKRLSERLQFQTAAGTTLPAEFVNDELQNSLNQTFRFRVVTRETEIHLEDGQFPHKPGQVRVVAGPGVALEMAQTANPTHVDWLSLKITRAAKP